MNTNKDFRTQLIELMDDRGMRIAPTDGLEGEELATVEQDNAGIAQLLDEICKLHERLGGKTAPKKESKPKEPKTETTETEDKPKRKTTKKTETEAEDKPKRKTTKKAETEGEPKEPKQRAVGNYTDFTARVTQANKGQVDGWDPTMVTVSLAKLSDAGKALMEHEAGAKFMALKGQQLPMSELLDHAKTLLTTVEKKVHPFKLAGLLWSAVDNKDPFVAAPATA